MPRKPQLPGAADFFAFGAAGRQPETEAESAPPAETTRPPAGEGGEAPAAVGPRRTTRPRRPLVAPTEEASARQQLVVDQDLAPSATIPQGPTEKVTFYLHPLSLRRLELLRAQVLVEHNLKVNRSQILDLLLEEALEHAPEVTAQLLALAEVGERDSGQATSQ